MMGLADNPALSKIASDAKDRLVAAFAALDKAHELDGME